MGRAEGAVIISDKTYRIGAHAKPHRLSLNSLDSVEIDSTLGKLADSEDSFLFVYCVMDPSVTNFSVFASVELSDSRQIENQTGFGIMIADTLGTANIGSRHRNHLLTGSFRTSDGDNHGLGVRVVTGYTDRSAQEGASDRILDNTRAIHTGKNESLYFGHDNPVCLSVEKNNDGFICTVNSASRENVERQTIFIPGCSFLTLQDHEMIYVGFAVGGRAKVRFSNIELSCKEGSFSITPDGTFRHIIPDYPFQRDLLSKWTNHLSEAGRTFSVQKKKQIYASPYGTGQGDGSQKDPVDLFTAVSSAAPGVRIILLEGEYSIDRPLYISTDSCGTCYEPIRLAADKKRKAVINGSQITDKLPLIILRGCCWQIDGLVFRGSNSCGIHICGSNNTVTNCEAYENGDTGFLICAFPGTSRESWPTKNRLMFCDSHDNNDDVRCNADGFGCKLSARDGNSFYQCMAWNNADDGFDLYSKSTLGRIGDVTADKCIAFRNAGIGFKLGGENQRARHALWNCVAYENSSGGFSANSNPDCQLHFCTAWNNYDGNRLKNYRFYHTERDWRQRIEHCLPPVNPLLDLSSDFARVSQTVSSRLFVHTNTDVIPTRLPDHSIDMHDLFSVKVKKGRRIGASIGDRKRILFLIHKLGGGGAEQVTVRLASALSQSHQVWLIYFSEFAFPADLSAGVTVINCSKKTDNSSVKLHVFQMLRRFACCVRTVSTMRRENKVDVTISMLRNSNIYNILASGGSRRILSERNDPSKQPWTQYIPNGICYLLGDHIVFQTDHVRQMYPAAVRRKSSVIMNPVEISCGAEKTKKHRIVNAGRLTKQKNQELLIKAFLLFHSSHPLYSLHIYGEGEMRDKLQRLIDDSGLSDSVTLEGYSSNLHEAICDAEIFVLSSDFEGMSNALGEAMKMGIPCVSTDCSGTRELIRNGIDGIIVPVGEVDPLAEAICHIADDSKFRDWISKNAVERAKEWDIHRIVNQWERIL